MAHFYGTIQGGRSQATRCGTKASGIVTEAAGWGGCIRVILAERDGYDYFLVEAIPWHGAGVRQVLAEGIMGELARESVSVPA